MAKRKKWIEVIRKDMRTCGLDENTVRDRGRPNGFNPHGIKTKNKIQGERWPFSQFSLLLSLHSLLIDRRS